jgi:hypothetical protein
VPTTGTSAPTGWAVLPVFERGGPYVASGTYQLPLFQGVPSRYIIQVSQWGGTRAAHTAYTPTLPGTDCNLAVHVQMDTG